MSVVALVVSIASLLIAAGALRFSRRADRRDDERFKRETADARARQEARPSAGYRGRSTSGERRRAYRYRVTNIGQADATDLEATLIDERGNVVSEETQPFYLEDGTGLLQSGQSTEFDIGVTEAALGRNPLFLHFSWQDDRSYGPREHTSGVEVPKN